ncbi:MAG: FAD binding domain-containing protein [Bacteroidota bacterium]
MIKFILNNDCINTALPPGMTLLDFVRYQKHLVGTKIGCREGDCGACTVLVGESCDDKVNYHSVTSCLMPIGNAHGKHIVTIEGINGANLNIVQQSFVDQGATQCGFCTPGFIVALTGYCLNDHLPTPENAIDAMNGNICRCTGYKSIEKAATSINENLKLRNGQDPLTFAMANNIVPDYFKTIPGRLKEIKSINKDSGKIKKVAGGTDLYVQQHDTIVHEELDFILDNSLLKGITQINNRCEMGASTTVSEMADSPVFIKYFPALKNIIKLVSSTPIRNMATVAGNFTNASPIGDLTIFFLALNAQLKLSNGNESRVVALRDFYKGYKQLDKKPEEIIEKIVFELPDANDKFNFEKVCKRTHLDIASVNTAILLKMNGDEIKEGSISAGGVGPVPKYLSAASEYISGKKISIALIKEIIEIAQTEISPISDARGTEAYKRLLLSQLIKAHFICLFPELDNKKILLI